MLFQAGAFAAYLTKYTPKPKDGNLFYQLNIRVVAVGGFQNFLNNLEGRAGLRVRHLFDGPITWNSLVLKDLNLAVSATLDRYEQVEFEATISSIKVSHKIKEDDADIFTYDIVMMKECDDGERDSLIMLNFLDVKEEDPDTGKKIKVAIPTIITSREV